LTSPSQLSSTDLEQSGTPAQTVQLPIAIPPGAKVFKVNLSQVNLQVHLRRIPLLAELSDDEITMVKADLRLKSYSRRDVVLQKGGPGDSLLFLLMGQLQVFDVTEDGRAIGLRVLSPGDFFGEIAVINGSTRSASVVALAPVLVGFLPAKTALHLFAHSPSVAKQMLRHLAEKVQRDSEFRALLSIQNTSRRVYNYLALFRQKDAAGLEFIANVPTHQEIAIMINTSRESVTRAILTLVQQEIVEKDQHRLIIRDPEGFDRALRGD
jgi:CRP-like cAMP-binding protein